ncbi:hypothetical protein RUM44_005936 [Polyplax serrata]|uniref:FYVE-type domain-containing protein n=1 Tax=Polyplax serrata TaxID=468196 RepID=A0ABR1AYJ8_POLSC
MSCYACLAKFSFFTREYSCPNCGLSYCSKCLREKVTLGEKEKNVCSNCHKKLTSNVDQMASSNVDTPDLLVKRLETLENPAKPPITIFRHSNRLMNLKSGLSSQDKQILERLERLKAERTATLLPDESEIKRRLALLQDRTEDSMSDKSKPQKFVMKSEEEQVNDLLNQYMAETGLDVEMQDEGNKAIDEIRDRLRRLQTSETTSTTGVGSCLQSDDGDEITTKIIKRAIAEGQLEKRLERPKCEEYEDDDDIDISDADESREDSDLPWCIICNENAVVKCLGCDGHLYCNTCFQQGHEFFNMEDHKTVPFNRRDSLS